MAVVVRCTGCRGASQVGPEAVGLLVICPRCHEPFLAIEEAPATAAPAKPAQPASSPAQPVRRRPSPRLVAEPVLAHVPQHPHEEALPASGGVPVSVLFGFALLPLAIPLLWLIGPQLLTKPPALTPAAPVSLAIAASTLCLAVVLTLDWTPSTRIKGVLILVGLSYFAGLSLYFLKKELVERVRDFFTPSQDWHAFQDPKGAFTITTPGRADSIPVQPLAGWKLSCFASKIGPFPGPESHFVFGSGPDQRRNVVPWFDEVGKAIEANAGFGSSVRERTDVKSWEGIPGQQWIIELADEQVRVIRVYRSADVVYYLSVEGSDLEAETPIAARFFNSFRIGPPPGK